MKRIAVFFDLPAYDDYPFNDPEYRQAYHEFGKIVHDKEGELHIVRGQKTYLGRNAFSRSWFYDPDTGTFVENPKQVTVDCIQDKGHFIPDSTTRSINVPELTKLCAEKSNTYTTFPKQSPASVTVTSLKGLDAAMAQMPGDFIVAKPVSGEEGKGVLIGPKSEVRARIKSFPYIIQEFIDTSAGIPGLTDGRHDLRMIVINSEIVYSYIRVPRPGTYLANVAQGGSLKVIEPRDIPPEALEIFQAVDKVFRKYPRHVYALDVCRGTDGVWKIIEINARPGLSVLSEHPGVAYFLGKLADLLLA